MFEYVILSAALSADAFAASISYGAGRIRIPFSSALMISAVCSMLLSLSIGLGRFLIPIISSTACSAIAFLILFLLGISKLFDAYIKEWIKKRGGNGRVQFKFFSLKCILNVYADPESADADYSRVLSLKEAFLLSLAMSLDGITIGFGVGLLMANAFQVFFCSLAITFVAVMSGSFIGHKLSRINKINFTYLSGLVLVILAFLKI